jgi:hypothetical protein
LHGYRDSAWETLLSTAGGVFASAAMTSLFGRGSPLRPQERPAAKKRRAIIKADFFNHSPRRPYDERANPRAVLVMANPSKITFREFCS